MRTQDLGPDLLQKIAVEKFSPQARGDQGEEMRNAAIEE